MITIVVGGQYGGEGKGKIAAFLGGGRNFAFVCRTGGVNSSHTVVDDRGSVKLRMLPATSVASPNRPVAYGAGSLIHIPTLHDEMRALGVSPSSVWIDPNAGVVSEDCIAEQRKDERYASIGSTLTGTGYASSRRAMRKLPLASEYLELKPYLVDVSAAASDAIARGDDVLLEGHQGAGLSNYHGDYPFTSSRDCSASALLSEVGIGPRAELEIFLVVKVFPTRNHAGHLPNEMSSDSALRLGIHEKGGGAWGIPDRVRRVGKIDYGELRRAVAINTPSYIALTGLDYIDPAVRNKTQQGAVGPLARDFITDVEQTTGVPVGLVSTGPHTDSTIIWAERLRARYQVGAANRSANLTHPSLLDV